jgi:L,D-peptidoglycan transpeptidase YkuD (ErfK/YbiS/YcfS/YnhG family)
MGRPSQNRDKASLADRSHMRHSVVMDWKIYTQGWIELDNQRLRAAFGRSGAVDFFNKKEGDGATPMGQYLMRYVLYRSDRMGCPDTQLPIRAINFDDGWCDEPKDPAYNRPVRLPYPASAENLNRDDKLYDIILVLGHNDDPAVPGLGSAIFLHCKNGDYQTTEGCVALAPDDVRALIKCAKPGDSVTIC